MAEFGTGINPECIVASASGQIAAIGQLTGYHIIIGGEAHILWMLIGRSQNLII